MQAAFFGSFQVLSVLGLSWQTQPFHSSVGKITVSAHSKSYQTESALNMNRHRQTIIPVTSDNIAALSVSW
jgi:hypothetical protein